MLISTAQNIGSMGSLRLLLYSAVLNLRPPDLALSDTAPQAAFNTARDKLLGL